MKNEIKTKWNFKLFYKSDKDPQIEKDFKTFEKAVSVFEKKYKNNTKYTTDATELLKACKDYEKLTAMPEYIKPFFYFHTRRDVDSSEKLLNQKSNEYEEKLNKMGNRLLFFGLSVGKISKDKQKEFLKDKNISKYNYFLKKIFEEAKYQLSEAEEKVINLFGLPANSMWVDGVNKAFNKQEIIFKGKLIPVNEAMGILSNLKTKDRRCLNHEINKSFMMISDFSEAEINAVFTTKKISDELRGFDKPYLATIKSYENEEAVVENLVKTVTNNFKVAHRFYKIKAKLLKENKLEYADRAASVGTISKNFSFSETVRIIGKAYKKLGDEYEKIFKNYLSNGQIDVYPKKGKKGGAYCWGAYGLPTVVFLNHTNNYQSVLTLGHEMGHAIHTEFSHSQPAIYADYTMSVAETASTLFENFVFDEIYESLSDKEKIVALHNRINDSVATIFRQIACFNFEKELHETIRKNGYCAKEDIVKIMNKHMKSYLGPVFDLKDEDGYFFTQWSHIRRFFYVYSYAYGCLISNAMYREYKKDKKFKDKIEQFLKAGGSKSPEDIFADIGINIRDPKFFENGIKAIEEDIKKLEKLVK
ncbi:MAG: hypothetical protein EOM85_01730 [Candidatus Moranbacteria bacterium]|nr:hypothetical protein [Candidatus Moranbacteria bacterium]